MTDESNPRDTVARWIIQYLLEHPAAVDSAAGIRHWWLRDKGEACDAVVRAALEAMVNRGWLVTRGDELETRIYGLDERNRAEAARFEADTEEHLNG